MTEYFKQIADAWGDRLRSPVLGSVLIFFVLINWQVLFYLFFANKPVRARLLYFEANTDDWNLFWWPLIAGVVSAIAVPWITLAGAYIAKLPREYLHKVQFLEASKRRIVEYHQRAEEESAIAAVEAAKEQRQIDAAKRLKVAETVSDELKSEIQEDRTPQLEVENELSLEDFDLSVLKLAAGSNNGSFVIRKGTLIATNEGGGEVVESLGSSHKDRMLAEDAIENLVHGNFLDNGQHYNGLTIYEITKKGYQALDVKLRKLNNPSP